MWRLFFLWIVHLFYKNYSETFQKLTLFHVSWTEKPWFWLNFPLLYVQNGSRYDSGGTGAQFYDAFLLLHCSFYRQNSMIRKTFTQIKSLNSKNWLSEEAWVKWSVLKLQSRNGHMYLGNGYIRHETALQNYDIEPSFYYKEWSKKCDLTIFWTFNTTVQGHFKNYKILIWE